jgi:predicted nucleic acid-binding protein
MISKQVCVVSDTSPLSAMAKMGWLPWLQERWGKVLVPGEVWRELSQINDPNALGALEAARNEGWLEVRAGLAAYRPEFIGLHAGEIEAMTLALDLRAAWLLVDDGDARRVALTLGLRIIGVLGMIVWAKQQGKLLQAMDSIADLSRITKFRISDEVLGQIACDLGETP